MPSPKQSLRRCSTPCGSQATHRTQIESCKSASKDVLLKSSIGAIAATSMIPMFSQLAGDFVGGPTHTENHKVLGKGPLAVQPMQSVDYFAAPHFTTVTQSKAQGSRASHKIALAVGGLSTAAAIHRRHNTAENQARFNISCAAMLSQTTAKVQVVDAHGFQRQQLEKLLATPLEANPGTARTAPEVHVHSTTAIIPQEAELKALYEDLEEDNGRGGGLAISQLTDAIKKLNEKYSLGLPEDYACQLALYVKKIKGRAGDMIFPVQQEEFVTGVHKLATSLHALSKRGVYLRELRHLLVHAGNDFAKSKEGELSLEALAAAMVSAGLDVQDLNDDVATCHQFLCLSKKDQEILAEVTGDSWVGQAQKVFEDKLQEMFGMKQIKQISRIWDDITKSAIAPGTVQEKAQRALAAAWDEADHLLDITEGAVDAAGIAVAVAYLQNQVQEALASGSLEDFDLLATVPLGLFLSVTAASAAQGLAELAPQEMTIDEALLYARIFSKHNFSQSEFRQLLSCPGCRWRKAESGETISHQGSSSSLKLIVKGRAAVMQGNGASSKRIGWLTPGSTLGEMEFLQEGTLWEQETTVAVEPLVFVEWDVPQLRKLLAIKATLGNKLESLLVGSMAETVKQVLRRRSQNEASEISQWNNEDCIKFHLEKLSKDQAITLREFRNLVGHTGLARTLCLAEQQIVKLFQRLDVNQDATVSVEELKLALPLLDRFQLNWKQDAPDLVRPLLEGTFSQECLCFVSDKLNFGNNQTDIDRLRNYLNIDHDSEMNLIQVLTRLNGICEVQGSLRGISLTELMMVISRAFEDWDANGDGVMDLDEFQMMNRELRLNLTEEQVTMLHDFFDTDKDGSIQADEWSAGCLNPNSVAHVLRGTLQDHVQRKGFDHLQYLLATVQEIAASPHDVGQKLKKIAAHVRDNTHQLADVLNGGLDFVSFPAALSGIYRELSGLATLDEIDGLDIAPFLIFSGLTLVSILRRLAQGQVSDMLGHEAFLYGKVFEAEGITVSEFKKMLEKWGATWRTIKQGGIVSQGSDSQLQIIALGSCSLSTRGEVQMRVDAGHFLGEEQFLDDSTKGRPTQKAVSAENISAPVALALEDTTVLSWDIQTLKALFESNAELPGHERLETQLRHLVTMSFAHKLLQKP